MPVETEIQEILLKYWGHSRFRPLQSEIIQSVLEGHDTLALLPTGGGKSVCFQVPALYRDGICVVISPLISLMKDQVENLRKKNIKAAAVVSGMSRTEIDVTFDNCIYGNFKFLYLSPERLLTDIALIRLRQMKINLIAVDEAHCISQWGYDFRPSYLHIADLRKEFPEVPVMALTATATPQVRDDIMQKLNFSNGKVFVKSFERGNLSYLVYHNADKLNKAVNILRGVGGCAIVYVRSRRRTKDVSDYLLANGIKANYYHAGLDQSERTKRQMEWMQNKTQVMVATNAFGMGIDKPDVRTVIHLDLPESPEAYYQEAGRAGRDEKAAYAVLLYQTADRLDLEQIFERTFPDIKFIRIVYNALGNFCKVALSSGKGISFDFDIAAFASNFNLNPLLTHHALRILAEAEYISLSEAVFIPARLKFMVDNTDLYNFQVQNPEADKIIKMILRSYGGIFDQYVKISESDLAKRLNVDVSFVHRQLAYFSKCGILDYQPQTDKPQLTFLIPRLRAEDVLPDLKLLEFRKKRFKERVSAMLNYAENNAACRSMMLLDYFGEKVTTRCGNCDYCRNRNKLELNDLEFERIRQIIKEWVNAGKITYSDINNKFPASQQRNYLHALQWLMDTEVIMFDEKQFLIWNE